MAAVSELMAVRHVIVRGLANRHRWHRADIDEAVQMAFISCLPYEPADLRSYAYICAAKKLAQLLTRDRERAMQFANEVAPVIEAQSVAPRTPEDELLIEEERRLEEARFAAVVEAINRLNCSKLRSTLKLHRIQGKSLKETARITGLSVHTVKRYDTLGIRQVRAQMRERA